MPRFRSFGKKMNCIEIHWDSTFLMPRFSEWAAEQRSAGSATQPQNVAQIWVLFQATEEHLMALILQKFYSIWIWNSGVVLLNINFILIVWHLITIIINLSIVCIVILSLSHCYPIIVYNFPWEQSRLAVFLVPGSCGHGPSTFPGGQQFLGTTVPKSQWIILRQIWTDSSEWADIHPLTDIAVRSPAIGQLWAALPLFPGWRQESGAQMEICGPLRHLEMLTYVDLSNPIDQFRTNNSWTAGVSHVYFVGDRDVLRRQWLQKVHISVERLKQS